MSARRFAFVGWTVAAGIAAALTVAHAAGLRLNFTHSAPSGLWQVHGLAAAAITRGTLVEVCPPAAPIVKAMRDGGYLARGWWASCPAFGVTPLLKPVAAVAGDHVVIRHGQAATVNGTPLPNTTAEPGIPAWPDGEYIVPPGHVWLFSSYSSASFDSRYFGPVAIDNVRGEAAPVLIRGTTATMTIGAK